jgi:hypothetical protein
MVGLIAMNPCRPGNELAGSVLEQSKIEEIGLLIGDKKAEAFALKVDWMKAESRRIKLMDGSLRILVEKM